VLWYAGIPLRLESTEIPGIRSESWVLITPPFGIVPSMCRRFSRHRRRPNTLLNAVLDCLDRGAHQIHADVRVRSASHTVRRAAHASRWCASDITCVHLYILFCLSVHSCLEISMRLFGNASVICVSVSGGVSRARRRPGAGNVPVQCARARPR